MRLSLTLTVALVAALSAGCIGAPGKTMTARDGLEDARSAAEEWAEGRDLDLLGIMAVEPFKHVQSTDENGEVDAEFVTHLDGDPGDGNAPGWVYGFFDGERCIVVLLAAGLGVLAEGYETCVEVFDVEVGDEVGDGAEGGEDGSAGDDRGPDVVGDWSFDSNEVAEILADREEWPDLGDDGTYFWGLFPEDGKTLWVVGGTGEDGESVQAVVDASTGEVIEVQHSPAGGFGFFGIDEPVEAGAPGADEEGGYTLVEDEAHATVVAPGRLAAAEVQLEGRGGYLVVDASVMMGVNGVGMVRAVLSGPDGEIQSEAMPNLNGGSVHFEVYDLPPGRYSLTVHSNNVGAAAVQVDAYLSGAWR